MGGPLLGGTALNGGAHWGGPSGCQWPRRPAGPRRCGALSVRGAPPFKVRGGPKSPASVLARLGPKTIEDRGGHLSASSLLLLFPVPVPSLSSPPHPAFASSRSSLPLFRPAPGLSISALGCLCLAFSQTVHCTGKRSSNNPNSKRLGGCHGATPRQLTANDSEDGIRH